MRVIGENGGNEAALAAPRQIDRLFRGVIGHDSADGAEGLDIVDGTRRARLVAIKQNGIEKGACAGIAGQDARVVGIAADDLRFGGKIPNAGAHFLALVEACKRSHANRLIGRITDGRLAETIVQGRYQRLAIGTGRNDTADGRAFLAGFHRHLARDFLDEEIELLSAGAGVKAEDGGVEAVCLHGETHGIRNDRLVRLQTLAGRGGAGESHHILAFDMVEKIADGAADELQRTFRQQAGFDDTANHELGEIGRLAGRLDDRGNAGKQGRRDLFQHAPAREIEGVDMHGNTLERAQDMLCGKALILGKLLDIAIKENACIRQLAPSLGGIGQQGPDAALDVDPAVGAGGARRRRKRIEFLLAIEQRLAERLQHRGALMEGHAPQRRSALVAAIDQGLLEIDAGGIDESHRHTGRRIEQRHAFLGAGDPAASDVAFKPARLICHDVHPCFLPSFFRQPRTKAAMRLSRDRSRQSERRKLRIDSSPPFGEQGFVGGMAKAEARQCLEAGRAGMAEAFGNAGIPIGDRSARLRPPLVIGDDAGKTGSAELRVPCLARQDGSKDFGKRLVGNAREFFQLHDACGTHKDIHDDRIDPAFKRIVKDGKPHVAALPDGADIGIAGKPRRPGMMDGITAAIDAESLHDSQDQSGMIGLFQHDARRGNALLNTGRIVDDIGKAGGAGQFTIDEARHQAQQFAAIARRHVVGRRQNAALLQIVLDRHRLGHVVPPFDADALIGRS